MARDDVRYDPVWRRIKVDSYARKLEGRFSDSRDRLAQLNNWGSLAWLYPHATASMLAHHYGLEHNAAHFLDGDSEREKYRASFRIAAHVLHWGHIPLSYAGAEALVRAAHVDKNARQVLYGLLDDVVGFASLRCGDDRHAGDCLALAKSGDRPFELYRWLSAWLVSRRWKAIWGAVTGLDDSASDEDEVKELVFKALVCRDDFGYDLLSLCNLADYVPRDLQQAGTAWLTVDIEALWETSPLRPDRAQEWSLLEAARDYLEDRFFKTPDAQLVHSLTARSVAQGLLNRGITRDEIQTLLSRGDPYYTQTFPDYHRRRLRTVVGWAKRTTMDETWVHVGTFDRVSVPAGKSRLDVEDTLTGRTGSGRLSYPPVNRN